MPGNSRSSLPFFLLVSQADWPLHALSRSAVTRRSGPFFSCFHRPHITPFFHDWKSRCGPSYGSRILLPSRPRKTIRALALSPFFLGARGLPPSRTFSPFVKTKSVHRSPAFFFFFSFVGRSPVSLFPFLLVIQISFFPARTATSPPRSIASGSGETGRPPFGIEPPFRSGDPAESLRRKKLSPFFLSITVLLHK